MRIKFWGTRGSIAVPGRHTILYGGNTACLEITTQNRKKVIVDAGTGIRALGAKMVAEDEEIEALLLITHIHWDHILGFPFFAPIFKQSSKIMIDGYSTCMKGLKSTFDNRMGDGFFPIKFDDLKADIRYIERLGQGGLEIDGTMIDTIPLRHPQGGLGFRFRQGEKKLVFITDNELKDDACKGGFHEKYIRFCKDADILIHDSQYTPQEIGERKGWGHSDYQTTFELAHRANVKRLILFHHDPSRKDPEVTAIKVQCEELASKVGSRMIIEAAREESELVL